MIADSRSLNRCGAPSVRETLIYLAEAKESGADYGLILPPAYWTAAMSAPVIEKFYQDVSCAPNSQIL